MILGTNGVATACHWLVLGQSSRVATLCDALFFGHLLDLLLGPAQLYLPNPRQKSIFKLRSTSKAEMYVGRAEHVFVSDLGYVCDISQFL